jgi:hypothetical protein
MSLWNSSIDDCSGKDVRAIQTTSGGNGMKRDEAFTTGRLNRRTMLKGTAALAAAAGLTRAPRVAAQDLSGELTFWHGLTSEATVLQNAILPAWTQANPNVKINV